MFAFSSGCMKCNEEESNLFFLRTQMAVRVMERTKDEFRQIRTNPSRSIHDSYNIFPPSTSERIPNRSPTDRNRDSRPRFPNIPHTATVYTHVETEFKRSIWSVIRDQRLVISVAVTLGGKETSKLSLRDTQLLVDCSNLFRRILRPTDPSITILVNVESYKLQAQRFVRILSVMRFLADGVTVFEGEEDGGIKKIQSERSFRFYTRLEIEARLREM